MIFIQFAPMRYNGDNHPFPFKLWESDFLPAVYRFVSHRKNLFIFQSDSPPPRMVHQANLIIRLGTGWSGWLCFVMWLGWGQVLLLDQVRSGRSGSTQATA